jgi:hypothetical protein
MAQKYYSRKKHFVNIELCAILNSVKKFHPTLSSGSVNHPFVSISILYTLPADFFRVIMEISLACVQAPL